MPGTYTFPGVYIQELPSGVRPITGVSTSDTAFVDVFSRGSFNQPARITSMSDFNRRFGGIDRNSEASYAIQQYFLNGGNIAWVVRVDDGSTAARVNLTPEGGASGAAATLVVTASSPGTWGNDLSVGVDYAARDTTSEFNLVVREIATVGGKQVVVRSETHRNVTMDKTRSRYVVKVVESESTMIRITEGAGLGERPALSANDVTNPTIIGQTEFGSGVINPFVSLGGGTKGTLPVKAPEVVTAMHALEGIAPNIFNILCLPIAATLDATNMGAVVSAAQTFCESRRAFLIVDIPETTKDDAVIALKDALGVSKNAAIYFPRIFIPDPLDEGRPRNVGVSGTVAGVFARTDATRGVWKAPAGTDATLRNVVRLAQPLTDKENGGLNPFGVNTLRTFPIFGNVVWGARTMEGADQQASEWKYIPVRRTALFIEESLRQALQWVVFEPNDEPLWSQIRLNVGTFMHTLFRQGAFQGQSPAQAYLVKCDGETTTQADIDVGVVNILVGFAPLKPAEFVIISLQQLAGQSQS